MPIYVRACLFVLVLANRTTFPLGLVKVMIVYFFFHFHSSFFCFRIWRLAFFPISNSHLTLYPCNHSTIAYILRVFHKISVTGVYVCALAIPILFDYCVLLSGFMYSRFIHSTRIFLILLEFNMFVIADVWKFCERVSVLFDACIGVNTFLISSALLFQWILCFFSQMWKCIDIRSSTLEQLPLECSWKISAVK